MHSTRMARTMSALSRFMADLSKLDRRIVRINAMYARGVSKKRKVSK